MFSKQIFADRLMGLLLDKGTTQQKLADVLNLKRQAVGHFVSANNLPSIESLVGIADYFDVSVDYLLGRTDLPRPDNNIDLKKYRCTKCPRCGNEDISEDAAFCKRCGQTLLLRCSSCNKVNLPDAIYCEYCGKQIQPGF